MRDYAIVSPRFWTGATGRALRKLGHTEQLVALYLITCPSSNMIGMYYLPIASFCHEIGCSRQGALKALRRVCETGFSEYDAASETILVFEMASWQLGDKLKKEDNRWKSVIKELSAHCKSSITTKFCERYGSDFNLSEDILVRLIDKGLASPFEAPSKPRTRTRAGTGSRARVPGVAAGSHQGLVEHFCTVWNSAYPENKGYTFKQGRDGKAIKWILEMLALILFCDGKNIHSASSCLSSIGSKSMPPRTQIRMGWLRRSTPPAKRQTH